MADRRLVVLLLAAPLALTVHGAHAGEPHEHDHRSHDAHVHGTWELFAALDESLLSVTIKGPLIDIVGFERAPETEDERSAIREIQGRLAAPELMLSLDERANCVLSDPVKIVLPESFTRESGDAQGDHAHETHKENGHHDHDAHEGEEHHAEHDVHTNDIEVSYSFDCKSPARLGAISMTGFDAFPAIENVDAVFLGDAKQTAQRLRRGTQILKLN